MTSLTRKPLESNVTDLDRLCRLLRIEDFETWDDRNIDSFWTDLRYMNFDSDEEREAAEQKEEQEARDEAWSKRRAAVLTIAEEVFAEHGLKLVPSWPKLSRSRRKAWTSENAWEFRIQPTLSWKNAADHVRTTIDGYGMFVFGTLRGFLSSGPYTAREAVLNHVGWIPRWYEVYGEGSASSRLDRALRY